jgi:uncharacterized membrane protein
MIRKLWPGILLNVIAFGFGMAMLTHLPERVASHWDAHGQVNGWMSRGSLVLMVPIVALVMAAVLAIAPRLDPKRRNFPLHAGSYWVVTNAVLAFLAAVQVLVIGYNLGWQFNFASLLGLGLGLLFILLGNVLTRVRPNWIFGIRTPWTLSSDRAWRETHRIGGYALVLTGIVALLVSIAWPHAATQVIVVGAAGTAVLSVVWSYFAWKNDPEAIGRDA